MERKKFLKIAGLTALSIPMISALNKLENITGSFESTKRMPVLFLGHGSPMNGIEDYKKLIFLKSMNTTAMIGQ